VSGYFVHNHLTFVQSSISSRRRPGFTLFEVAISLVILAVAILAMALAYPVGIKAQQLTRFKLYAGVKALEILDTFANHDHQFFDRQIEAQKLGQCTFPGGAPADLERMAMFSSLGLLPLPNEIAKRLDSDDNEISRIIESGGRIFYSSAFAFETGYQIRGYQRVGAHNEVLNGVPSEAQSLLFAVVGYAQQNALANHPCLAWPYFAFYPSPAQSWEKASWDTWAAEGKLPSGAKAAFDALYKTHHTGLSYPGMNSSDEAEQPIELITRFKLAQDLMVKVMPASLVDSTGNADGPLPLPPLNLPASGGWNVDDDKYFPKPWQLLALRYLTNIAMLRSVPGAPASANSADMERYADDCHRAMATWTMRYATGNPYDWGAPRPLNRQNAMDFPLLQFDLFPSVNSLLPYPVGDTTNDVTWRVIAPRQPVNYGSARGRYGYPNVSPQPYIPNNHGDIDTSWGEHPHFNLTKPFAAAERDRQLVCFSVDWRSYEDFEKVPSGPHDGTCYNYDSRGIVVDFERSHYPPDVYDYWSDEERKTLHEWIVYPFFSRDEGELEYLGDGSNSVRFKERHLGVWGADRNGNGIYDTGIVPASVRLRAVTISRWNFYDRRFICALRY
jgi:prepilin-type N-terminal cleavage/methylation domain-containing protein